jgi:hypothetical protein
MVAFKGEKVVGGRYVFFGDHVGGNNVSEAMSLKCLLEWILDNYTWKRGQMVAVVGDNRLCISFMRGEAKPRLR